MCVTHFLSLQMVDDVLRFPKNIISSVNHSCDVINLLFRERVRKTKYRPIRKTVHLNYFLKGEKFKQILTHAGVHVSLTGILYRVRKFTFCPNHTTFGRTGRFLEGMIILVIFYHQMKGKWLMYAGVYFLFRRSAY